MLHMKTDGTTNIFEALKTRSKCYLISSIMLSMIATNTLLHLKCHHIENMLLIFFQTYSGINFWALLIIFDCKLV